MKPTLQFWRDRGPQCRPVDWLHRAREWSRQEGTPESSWWLTRAYSGHISPHLFRRGALPRPQHWPNSIPSKPIRLWGCFQTQEDQSMFRTEGTSAQFTANETQATNHKLTWTPSIGNSNKIITLLFAGSCQMIENPEKKCSLKDHLMSKWPRAFNTERGLNCAERRQSIDHKVLAQEKWRQNLKQRNLNRTKASWITQSTVYKMSLGLQRGTTDFWVAFPPVLGSTSLMKQRHPGREATNMATATLVEPALTITYICTHL